MVELVVLTVVILVGLIMGIRHYKKITKVNLPSQELISKGKVILIKPENVEIKTSEQWIETEKPMTRTAVLDTLVNKPGVTNQKRIVSYLIYQTVRDNKLVKFVSQPIYKDKASILMVLSNLDAIKIYIDPANVENYYFDISSSAGIVVAPFDPKNKF